MESQMHHADKLVMDTEKALEEYVYDMHGKLEGRYVKGRGEMHLTHGSAEDWLYTEEGEDATKSGYVSRLDALKYLEIL